MAIVGFTNEFIAYMKNSPENVRRIVEKMLSDERSRNEFIAACKDPEVIAPLSTEKIAEVAAQKLPSDFENSENICEINPYSNLDFSKRIELEELVVTLTNSDKCDIHDFIYEKSQVVFLYDGVKRYGCYLNCCPKCKRFFMNEKEFKELEISLNERNIKYSIAYDGGER